MKEYLPWHRPAFDHAILRGMDGWLSDREADLLFRLSSECTGKGAIVEIGSWKGKSTTCLALGSRKGAGTHITAIDPHTGSSEHGKVDTYAEFLKNIERNGVADMVEPVRARSQDIGKTWQKPVELLWIDGAHEYEFVLEDLRVWQQHLIEGGVVAFHDSTMPGPWKVIEDHLYRGNAFHSIGFVHGITYAVRGKATPVRNMGMMLLRNAAYGLWRAKKMLGR
ncbi:class I SAM-dependent methyltransferase [Candidatus Peregrinibacteria bacterium]|nr:class I SAM-dependent methyltransferase [Candidatus Peregrinibacteria bacterium]